MSPTKKTATKKKAPAKKAAPKKAPAPPRKSVKKEPAPAPASTRRGPAPKSLQKRNAAAAEEKKMQKAKAAAPAAGRRAGGDARGKGAALRTGVAPAAAGLGTKYSCFKCGSKFYDLNRPKALCPKCGADQKDAPKLTAKQARAQAQQLQQAAPPPKALDPEIDRERDRERERERDARRIGPLLDEDDEEIVIEDDSGEDLDLALEVVEDEEFLEAEEEEPEEES